MVITIYISILEHKLQRQQFDTTLAEKEQALFQTVINLFFFFVCLFDYI